MMTFLLLGCTSTDPSPTNDPTAPVPPGPMAPPSSPGSPQTTPVQLPCTSVQGTRGVWLFSRQDPSLAVVPVDPPDGDDLASRLAGPDALGRLYLLDGNQILRRSDDQGCTWQQMAVLPEDYSLLTSQSTERLYAYDGPALHVSEDGGLSFSLLTESAPGLPIAVRGGTSDELRANTNDELFRSVDGGVSWAVVTTLPDQAGEVYVDSTHIERAILGGSNGIWMFDGTTWTEQSLTVGPYADLNGENVRWRGDSVVVQVNPPGDCLILRSDTAAAPFTEMDWGFDIDDSPDWLAFDGEQIVVAGHHNPGLNSEATGPITGLVVIVDGAAVHRHLPDGMDDARGIAFTEDFIVVAFTPRGTWQD